MQHKRITRSITLYHSAPIQVPILFICECFCTSYHMLRCISPGLGFSPHLTHLRFITSSVIYTTVLGRCKTSFAHSRPKKKKKPQPFHDTDWKTCRRMVSLPLPTIEGADSPALAFPKSSTRAPSPNIQPRNYFGPFPQHNTQTSHAEEEGNLD